MSSEFVLFNRTIACVQQAGECVEVSMAESDRPIFYYVQQLVTRAQASNKPDGLKRVWESSYSLVHCIIVLMIYTIQHLLDRLFAFDS